MEIRLGCTRLSISRTACARADEYSTYAVGRAAGRLAGAGLAELDNIGERTAGDTDRAVVHIFVARVAGELDEGLTLGGSRLRDW